MKRVFCYLSVLAIMLLSANVGGRYAQTRVVEQYGPHTTATGREVTVILESHGFPHTYVTYTRIKEVDGTTFKTDIWTKCNHDKNCGLNNFVIWVDTVRSGGYEYTNQHDNLQGT